MLRKKEVIKRVQTAFDLSSFEKAEEHYEKFLKIWQDGLDEVGSIKIEKIGIIKKITKSGRSITVPTKSEKIVTEDRIGLSFKEDKQYKGK